MKEITTPALSGASDYPNATELLMQRFRIAPDHIAFEVRSSLSSITDPWRGLAPASLSLKSEPWPRD
ncbi:hypothetical protein NHF46_01465 [Arthrobacter alpinus]|nr:hypothetical protein [Arthrobacter alpinus]